MSRRPSFNEVNTFEPSFRSDFIVYMQKGVGEDTYVPSVDYFNLIKSQFADVPALMPVTSYDFTPYNYTGGSVNPSGMQDIPITSYMTKSPTEVTISVIDSYTSSIRNALTQWVMEKSALAKGLSIPIRKMKKMSLKLCIDRFNRVGDSIFKYGLYILPPTSLNESGDYEWGADNITITFPVIGFEINGKDIGSMTTIPMDGARGTLPDSVVQTMADTVNNARATVATATSSFVAGVTNGLPNSIRIRGLGG